MMDSEGADFIITGEVVGQRPMSQNKKTLLIIDSESGFEGLILRPLCAKKLPISLPERYGWVDREKMLDLSGRSRKPQIALAKKMNIMKYPSPAGGCLLTDRIFSSRLKDLFSSSDLFELREIELLKLGRHFRIGPKTKIIIGRNQAENHAIVMLASERDLRLNTISVPGPTAIVMGEITPELEERAAIMTVSYSDAGTHETEINLKHNGVDKKQYVKGVDKRKFVKYML
jgi:tRNA U34 2-thiouridine synthase MnmA/TrmU